MHTEHVQQCNQRTTAIIEWYELLRGNAYLVETVVSTHSMAIFHMLKSGPGCRLCVDAFMLTSAWPSIHCRNQYTL